MRTPTLNVEFNLSRTHEDVIHGVDEWPSNDGVFLYYSTVGLKPFS
jgi:hypothetical protein